MKQTHNIWTTEDKNLKNTICNVCFWCTCDLEQVQGHQAHDDNVNPEQGYYQAKFERSCFNGVWEKINVEAFFQTGNMSIISLEC